VVTVSSDNRSILIIQRRWCLVSAPPEQLITTAPAAGDGPPAAAGSSFGEIGCRRSVGWPPGIAGDDRPWLLKNILAAAVGFPRRRSSS
jgi:hypothetical protein